jgi:hypothetical protein
MHGSRLAFVLPRIPTPTSWLVLSAGGRLARTREVAARSRLERPGIVVGWLVLLVRCTTIRRCAPLAALPVRAMIPASCWHRWSLSSSRPSFSGGQ